jgi:hypothetical protein
MKMAAAITELSTISKELVMIANEEQLISPSCCSIVTNKMSGVTQISVHNLLR